MAILEKTRSMVVILGVLLLFVSGCVYGRGLTYSEGNTLMERSTAPGSAPLSARPAGTPARVRGSAVWWARSSVRPLGMTPKVTTDTGTETRMVIPIMIPTPTIRIIGGTAARRPPGIRITGRIPRTIPGARNRSPIRTTHMVRRIPQHRHIPRSTTRSRIDG
jgi:hypothetical protein